MTNTSRRRKWRFLSIVLANVGLFAMILPALVGRPPIDVQEAQRHRSLMVTMISVGAIAGVTGAVSLFLVDR